MKRRPRDIGTAAESAVVKYLHTAGFPHAERRSLRGALDAGDITGTPAVAWEVKGGDAARTASDLTIQRWMAELATEVTNAKADVGLLVVQRAGVGPANAGRWWAYMTGWTFAELAANVRQGFALCAGFPVRMLLADAVTLLRAAGYGEPAAPGWTDAELDDCAFCAVRGVGRDRTTGCPIHAEPARPVVAPPVATEAPCFNCGQRESDHVDGRCSRYQPNDPEAARPMVAPYLPTAATPEGIEDIALPGLEVAR